MKNIYIKVLIISFLCLFLYGCKSQSNVTEKDNLEREDNTDDVRNEQMADYEEDMKQQFEENNQY